MTRKDIDDIISILCPNDEDYEKPIISPKYLRQELEQLALNQEPYDDAISRQAAIDAIEHRLAEPAYQHEGEDWYTGMNCAESELYDLPPAEPRKKGKWIKHTYGLILKSRWGECSICGNTLDFAGVNAGRGDANYCPNCGEKMEGEEESE